METAIFSSHERGSGLQACCGECRDNLRNDDEKSGQYPARLGLDEVCEAVEENIDVCRGVVENGIDLYDIPLLLAALREMPVLGILMNGCDISSQLIENGDELGLGDGLANLCDLACRPD